MTIKRSTHVTEYAIKEWLSRRNEFYTAEFAERFYSERPQSANVRLDRLKQKGFITKPNGEIGVWRSNIKPDKEPPSISINTPVVNDLPNPIKPAVKPVEKVEPIDKQAAQFLKSKFNEIRNAVDGNKQYDLNNWSAKRLLNYDIENPDKAITLQELMWLMMRIKRDTGDDAFTLFKDVVTVMEEIERKDPNWADL